MATGLPFTTTTLLAAAADVLENSGYRPVPRERIGSWPSPNARVYEDPYSIAALMAYDTWGDLAGGWLDAQGALWGVKTRFASREIPICRRNVSF